jgi:methionyl-tRNA formyltransferase
MNKSELKIAFFGGEPLGLPALKSLHNAGLTPKLVVCNPDRPRGRGLELTPPPIKVWAQEHNITVFQPDSYKDKTSLTEITDTQWDLFVVVAYNFILPKWFLELPKYGTINVHPSLLPKLRGMSPIRTAILEDRPDEVGVSIMLMDEEMDHGPLLAQVPYTAHTWPSEGTTLDRDLAELGGKLLAETILQWVDGSLTPTEQNHEHATYTKRFLKTDSELHINPHNLPTGIEARDIFCKIQAFSGIGDTFFIYEGKRVKVKGAALVDDTLRLTRVIPEGKKEVDFTLYLASCE